MLGPGAASAAEFEAARPVGLSAAAWLALMIATGIGLHNFSEGLAIGQSAAQRRGGLALTLVIGFALHNATEGFGIVAPLVGRRRAADLALPAPARRHRRRPDVLRDADRPGVDERGALRRVPRARGRVDPLRHHRARRRQPAARPQRCSSPGAFSRGLFARLRHGLRARGRRRVAVPLGTRTGRVASRSIVSDAYVRFTRSCRHASSRVRSRTRSRTGWARERWSRCTLGRSQVRGVVVGRRGSSPERGSRRFRSRRCRRDAARARRSRALDRRVLRLDACAGARARGAAAPARRGERRAAGRVVRARRANEPAMTLSEPQEQALAAHRGGAGVGGGHFLLWGATGSGKTEVYLRACAAARRARPRRDRPRSRDRAHAADARPLPRALRRPRGGAALGARRRRSGATSASGSRAARRGSSSARDRRCSRRCGGSASSAWTRSTTPSYKQESDPRYDARTVAAKRAALEGAVAVYGSATPRPESWARARAARARRAPRRRSAARARRRHAPRERAIRCPRRCSRSSRGVAERGGRAILLLNRRGVAPGRPLPVLRRDEPLPDCDVALVLHRDGVLRCHHCGYARGRARALPCVRLARARAARRRDATARARARAAGSRARADPARRGHAVEARPRSRPRSTAFRADAGPVLLGTQMVAKGHHFAGVELAAVVDADLGLALPDFRAEERTFQLVTQLAGRSGREAPGRVDRADVPARRPGAPLRGPPRRGRVSRGGARAAAGARLSAVPASRARARHRAGRRPPRRARSRSCATGLPATAMSGLHRCRGSAAATAPS